MKIFKIIIKAIALTLVIILPFVAVPTVALFTPQEYGESFVGALDEKVERLYSIEEPKLVVVGGSSVAFGIDSKLIEKYVGMPVVNFGLYAALGTKIMLDLSVDAIGEGDVVVIAPELDAQTLSLFFNPATALRAMDGSPSMLKHIPSEHYLSLLAASWDFLGEKLEYKFGDKPTFEGVYTSESFDSYGDIIYERAENIMPLYYDPNLRIDPTPSIVSADFLAYLNGYVEKIKEKGASVYFEFCPMNSLGFADGSTEDSRREFFKYLKENLACQVIAPSMEEYIYEAGYFYDSNFHLNDAGVIRHTVNVIEDLLLELGIPRSVKEQIPEPPALPMSDVRFFGEDENADMFLYERMADGSYMIVGVKEEYRSRKSLTVPLGYDTYKVSAIGRGALSDSLATELILTEDTNVRMFVNGAFEGASSLSRLVIYYPHEADIMPPVDFVGTASGFKVFIPEGSAYAQGYFWSERGLTFETIK